MFTETNLFFNLPQYENSISVNIKYDSMDDTHGRSLRNKNYLYM